MWFRVNSCKKEHFKQGGILIPASKRFPACWTDLALMAYVHAEN